MKKYVFLFLGIGFHMPGIAQENPKNTILMKHDTTLLSSADCAWVIKSLVKNDPALTADIGKEISILILQAVEKGKIKAYDPLTDEEIPAKEIFTWKITGDTLPEYDAAGAISRYVVSKKQHAASDLNQLRVYHDWYFDIATGKMLSIIKWIELMEDIRTSFGIFIGQSPLCRIYY